MEKVDKSMFLKYINQEVDIQVLGKLLSVIQAKLIFLYTLKEAEKSDTYASDLKHYNNSDNPMTKEEYEAFVKKSSK